MPTALRITNATLPDGRTGVEIVCHGDRIVALGPGAAAPPDAVVLDAAGMLVSPPLVDAHFHLDAALSLGRPRLNVSGTLLEGIALWGELKAEQRVEEIIARALRYCDLAVSMGIGAIRSHVDVCDDALLGVRALLEVRRQVAGYLDLQLVAFPQDGLLRDPRAHANLLRALDLGVEVVGGIPHFERTRDEGARSVRLLCELAAERGLRVDLHCDETDDPHSRHIETLAAEVVRCHLEGRATGSHLTSMHSMDDAYVAKLLPLLAEAGLHAVANPLINVMLQGRYDGYPRRRGMTRVRPLRDAGVNVSFGSDCVMDPWYSLGRADMLDVALMGLHLDQLSSRADMAWCFSAVTHNPAQALGLPDYGLEVGCYADLVVHQARDPIEALRLRGPRLAVIRRGAIIAQTAPAQTQLALPGRPALLDPADILRPA